MKIIAEIGWNHMGDMNLAKKMISRASENGADICKFQTWSEKNLKPGSWDNDGRREIYKKAQLSKDQHLELKEYCESKKVKFLTTIFNKVDLVEKSDSEFELYQKLGYPVIKISAKEKINLNPLFNLLNQQTTVLVGQSGVGKSTIINLLIPKDKIRTEALSNKNQKGKHTTSTSTMHAVEDKGYLIDTPGIENLNPKILDIKEIETGFREISSLSCECRYRDCIHINEPNCAVNRALSKNEIAAQRYSNYKKLVDGFQ